MAVEIQRADGATRVAHLSDLHIGSARKNPSRLECFRWWLDELSRAAVSVLVVSGDIVNRSDDKAALAVAREALESSRFPGGWVVVPGNHDVPSAPKMENHFFTIFGNYPRIEQHAGVDFVLLDSNAGIPFVERGIFDRFVAPTGFLGACITEGCVGAEQLARCSALISSKQRPRVVVLHHHLVHQAPDRIFFGVKEDIVGGMRTLRDAASVRAWAAAHHASVILHGHKHVMMRAGIQEGGVVVLNGGSSTQGPPPFRGRLIDLHPSGSRRIIEVEMVR